MSIFPKSQNKTKNKVPLGSAGVPTICHQIKDKTKNKVPLWSTGVPTIYHQIKGIFYPKDKANLNQRIKGFLPKRQWFFLG